MRAAAEASSGGAVIELPPAKSTGGLSLAEALRRRESVREFTSEGLSSTEVAELLFAAQGTTRPWGGRTAPSAGALYPLELYVLTADGLARYLPPGHRLERLSGDDLRRPLSRAALHQGAVADAPAVFVIAAVPSRTAREYGSRAARYVELEAGHAAQNLLLQAVALGLGSVPIGAFDDAGVRAVLGLPGQYVPLYLIPVGHPA